MKKLGGHVSYKKNYLAWTLMSNIYHFSAVGLHLGSPCTFIFTDPPKLQQKNLPVGSNSSIIISLSHSVQELAGFSEWGAIPGKKTWDYILANFFRVHQAAISGYLLYQNL